MNATVTKEFTMDQAQEAAQYMASVKGSMDAVNGKLVVTSSALDAGYALANELGVTVVKGATKTAKVTGNVAAGTVRVASAVTGVVIKSSVPVAGALGSAVITTAATVVNAGAGVVGELQHTWKEDASVQSAKAEVVGAYDSIKASIPKSFKLGGFEIKF